jgi:hypothetical protein
MHALGLQWRSSAGGRLELLEHFEAAPSRQSHPSGAVRRSVGGSYNGNPRVRQRCAVDIIDIYILYDVICIIGCYNWPPCSHA